MTDRPTDELTARVVAEWMGWEKAYKTWDSDVFKSDRERHVPFADNDHIQRCPDPRDDTNAALRLLGWVRTGYASQTQLAEDGRHWLVYTERGTKAIPLSGEPFRYSVVALAGEVCG
jgi:hypothetical protein